MMASCATPSFLISPVKLIVKAQRQPFVVINNSVVSANYTIVAQTREELLVPQNSPSLSMWPYLVDSGQTRQLNQISVYAQRGTSRDQSRLLYMNAAALNIWREMGMTASAIGETFRPPRTAQLCFGMPFSQ